MRFIGALFGVGYLPGAPGTYASGIVVGAWMLLHYLGWWPEGRGADILVPLAAAAVFSTAAIVFGRGLEDREEDPHWFVLDECAGQWLALTWLSGGNYWLNGLIVFGLFRLFDIIKPGPVRRLEKLPCGWGIVADDLASGLLAWASWRLLALVIPALTRALASVTRALASV